MAKFRSWNEKLKCFIYFEDGMYFIDEESKCKDNILNLFNWLEDEQSTGLFDKNGKEIFKNDELRNEQGIHFVIHFGEWGQDGSGDEYGPSQCLGFYVDVLQESEDWCKYVTILDFDLEYFEVVGNIHEGVSNG